MIITMGFGQHDSAPPVFSGLISAVDMNTGGEVRLTWPVAVDVGRGVSCYNIYYSTSLAQVWAEGVKLKAPPSSVDVVIGGLINGTPYYFGVRAQDAEYLPNEDQNSVVKSATPTPYTVSCRPTCRRRAGIYLRGI